MAKSNLTGLSKGLDDYVFSKKYNKELKVSFLIKTDPDWVRFMLRREFLHLDEEALSELENVEVDNTPDTFSFMQRRNGARLC